MQSPEPRTEQLNAQIQIGEQLTRLWYFRKGLGNYSRSQTEHESKVCYCCKKVNSTMGFSNRITYTSREVFLSLYLALVTWSNVSSFVITLQERHKLIGKGLSESNKND